MKKRFLWRKRFLIFMLAENNDCFQCQRYYRHLKNLKKWLSKSLATLPGGNIMWTNARAGPWDIPVLQWSKKVQPTWNKERVLIPRVHLISTADKREYNFKHCPRCVETKQRWKVKFYPWTNSDSLSEMVRKNVISFLKKWILTSLYRSVS